MWSCDSIFIALVYTVCLYNDNKDLEPWHFLAAGIERTGNRVRRPTKFTVDTFSAGQGQVTIYLDHPDGTTEEVCLFLILCGTERRQPPHWCSEKRWLFFSFKKQLQLWFESVCASAEGGAERGQEDVLRQLHPSSHWTSSGQRVEKLGFIIYFNMHIVLLVFGVWVNLWFFLCCCCSQGESFVCGSTHPKKPVWGGCGQSSGRRHQGDGQRPRHWAGGQRCQQTHLLRHLHSRSENWGTETDCQRFFNVMKCWTAKVKTSKASQKWHTSVQLWSRSWSALFQNQGKPQVCWKNNLPVVSSGSWCLHCYIFSCVCLTLFVLFLEHSHQNDVYLGGER